MTILLLFCYTLFFCALFLWLPFYKNSGFKPVWLTGLFLLKALAGMAYGWFFMQFPDYARQSDTWRYFFGGIQEKSWLLHDPAGFLSDLVRPRYAQDGGLMATQNSLLNDVKDLILYKLMAIFNLFSGNRYWVNVLFFNFITLFGLVALARVWASCFKEIKPFWVLAFTALLPSALFWCSGIHKDGLLLHAAGWGWWCLFQIVDLGKKKAALFAGLFFSLLLLFLLRNVMALLFAVAAVAWWLAASKKQPAIMVSAWLLGVVVVFFTAGKWWPGADFPAVFAQRQQEFLRLPGESLLPTTPLEPSFGGFLRQCLPAVNHGFLRPYPWQILKWSYLPAAIELAAFWLLLSGAGIVFFTRRQWQSPRPGIVAALVFCLSAWLVIGYTIPYLGAILRYKALLWPFMVPPLCGFILRRWPFFRKPVHPA